MPAYEDFEGTMHKIHNKKFLVFIVWAISTYIVIQCTNMYRYFHCNQIALVTVHVDEYYFVLHYLRWYTRMQIYLQIRFFP